MKLLLTSNGLTNESIKRAFVDLVGKPKEEMKVAFIPTAAFSEDEERHENRDWLVDDMNRIKEMCSFFDIVSLADAPAKEVLYRLEYADVIFVSGGNTFYLSYWMDRTRVFDALPKLLETRVYGGISAGSMIASPTLRTSSQAIQNRDTFYAKEYDELGPPGHSSDRTADLVDFVFRPHLNSREFPDFPNFLDDIVKDTQLPMYALDDQSALKVIDGEVEVVTEGEWKLIKS